ncbi:2TM domain-containing protein [Galbibacter sp.]|uniref:2TM domain-containing protein n=1 Tax=Galbibacter sp. TaxID=2918471 RepID=UPI002C5B3296|nr:2TM domain-containing protein [Galbibacter sp.]HLV61721.1 2TM domain-containing protein [Galbibacter sp.]
MMLNVIKDTVRGILVGIVVFVIITIIYYSNQGQVSLDKALWSRLILTLVYTMVLFIANASFFRWIRRHHKFKINANSLFLITSIGAVLLSYICLVVLNFGVQFVVNGATIEEFLIHDKLEDYLIPLAVSFIVGVAFSGFHLYRSRQESKFKQQKFIAGAATAQFDALKSQLDPHFLFNSLNVLNSLIEENTEAAQKFTTLLSKVYRYVLEQKSKELVTVEEELNFAKAYMTLVRMRFENSIVFEVAQNINFQAKVVPCSLQLLLENAIKHNQITQDSPLVIKIYQKDNYLIVSNNYKPKAVIKHSIGVGLVNIKQRYALLTAREVEVGKSDCEFSVKLPLLTKRVKMEQIQEVYIDEKRYALAKKKVEELKGFYGNLTAYIFVIPFLIWVYFITYSGFPWIVFPVVGWGIGIVLHGLEVFNYHPFISKETDSIKYKKLKEFYTNLTAYVLVIPFLAWINHITSPEFSWVIFPIIGWGIGLAIHGMEAYNYHPFLGKDWEEKKMKEIMNKDNKNK